MLVARELCRSGLDRSATLRRHLRVCLVLGMATLAGCRLSESAPEPAKAGPAPSPSRDLTLAEYLNAVEEGLQRLELLEGKDLELLPADTRRRGRDLRERLASGLKTYRALLDRLASLRREPSAAGLEVIVRECLDVRRQVVDLARRYRDWHASLRDLEVGFSTTGAGREEFRRAREYAKLSGAMVELFSDAGEQLARHHETRLLRAEDEVPALTALHFLVLERLGEGELDRHLEVARRAWARWLRSQGERVGPAAALGVVAAGFEIEKRYRPVSLDDMSEVVQTCLEYTPALPDIHAMEVSLSAIERVFRAETSGEETEPADFRRARAVLWLSLARRLADPIEGMRLAAEAGRMNPKLEDDVEVYLREAGRELLEEGAARETLGESFDAYARALEENDVPERHTLLEDYRRLVLERALVEADEATRKGEFEKARVFVGDAFGLARGEGELRQLGEATREFYVSYARLLEEADPARYLSFCREMVERLPRDPTARRLLDRGYLLRLREVIGDVASSFRRFSARELLAVYREALSRVRSEDGAQAFQDYLEWIREAWKRQLARVDDPEESFRFAAEVGVLAGWSQEETLSRSAEALARVMTVAADAGEWPIVEGSVTMWFRECPLQPRPWNLQEIQLRLLAHLDGNDLFEDLARHLAYFLATFPEKEGVARQFVERLDSGAPETLATFEETFRATQETLGTEVRIPPIVKGILGRAGDGVEDSGKLERVDGGEEGGLVQEGERSSGVDGLPAPGDRPDVVEGEEKPRALVTRSSDVGREGRRHPAGRMLFVAEAAGCAFLALSLFLLTASQGLCRFRWYALAAFWMGVTAGSAAAF